MYFHFFPPDGTSNELPLFGNFCCRIAAQPLCLTQLTTSGYLDLKVSLHNLLLFTNEEPEIH